MRPAPHVAYYPRIIEQFSKTCRKHRLSTKTEVIYHGWIVRFLYFHNARHPSKLSGNDVEAYLDELAHVRNVSPGTRRQARCALRFLYRHVLDMEIDA